MSKQAKNNFFSLLAAPARRALDSKGIKTIQQLAKFSEAEILALHGIGKSAIPILRSALDEQSLSFKNNQNYIMTKLTDTNEYIAGFPKETRERLEEVRATIKNAAPGSEETISYGIPAFKLHNLYLIYFAGYKNHIGLYPAPVNNEIFKKELSGYKTGKGSVQFPLDKPTPLKLVTKIVKFRAKENEEKSKAKKAGKPASKSSAKPPRSPKPSDEEQVYAYMTLLGATIKDEINSVRKIIKRAAPALNERIKWNAPSYHYMQQDLLTFGPQKNGKTMLVFHHPAIVKIKSGILEGNYKDRRLMHFNGKADVIKKKKELEKIIKELVELVEGTHT